MGRFAGTSAAARARGARKQAAPPEIPPGALITALVPGSRNPDRLTVRIGRIRAGTIARSEADSLGLTTGTPWDADLARRFGAATARALACDRAAKLLARRPMSRAELLRRLQQKGATAEAAASAADQMTRLGLLNDAAYAKAVVSSELRRKPAGRPLLAARLAKRGIARGLAEGAIAEGLAERDQLADATELARRRLARMSPRLDADARRRRLYGLLARRGFDPGTCRRAVDLVCREE